MKLKTFQPIWFCLLTQKQRFDLLEFTTSTHSAKQEVVYDYYENPLTSCFFAGRREPQGCGQVKCGGDRGRQEVNPDKQTVWLDRGAFHQLTWQRVSTTTAQLSRVSDTR